MSVILHLDTGDKVRLDRNLTSITVVGRLNEQRGHGRLVAFQNDDTPSQRVYVDVDRVVKVTVDR